MRSIAALLALVAASLTSHANPQPYTDRLPGTQVDVGVDAGYVGIARDSVRELLHVGSGATRVGLLVGIDRRDQTFCVGYRHTPAPGFQNLDFRCADDALIVFAGRRGATPERVDELSLVGAVRDDAHSVELQYADGRRRNVPLRIWEDSPIAAFAVEAERVPFAARVVARDIDGGVVDTVSLRAARSAPCTDPSACVGVSGAWTDAIDPQLPG